MQFPSLTIGIEEEYLLVDRETRNLVASPDPALHAALSDTIGKQVTQEFLQCQVEVGSAPAATADEARDDLAHLRRAVSDTAAEYGCAIIAASTHPFAKWRDQAQTQKERYDGVHADLAQNARRMLISGCHVHACIEDPDMRIDLMNQVGYFLPHLLALSCSSPFWEGEDTGLSSYRLTVMDALPRTGLPDAMPSFGEYERFVNTLVNAGCLEDSSKIWWDVRPSSKYPTLEMRIADICTRLDDAVCLAAMYQCALSFLLRLRQSNQRWRVYPSTLIAENRWRAQRYGTTRTLLDLGKGEMTPVADLVDELIELFMPDAERLNCVKPLMHAKTIVSGGTSATRQREAFATARQEGADTAEALKAVVDHLIAETLEGV